MNLNKVFIVGNLTRDPELRSLPSGQSVASFAIATNRFYTNKENQKQQDTQFHNIVAFGKLADIARQYLNKGSLVLIEGRIQNRSWEGQDGQKKYRSEIVAQSMQLGPRGAKTGDETNPPQQKPAEKVDTIEYDEENINPDEIPF
ncbi:single-stranded DNA-binding protein [Patescibacteria group bacterium]|nr:single-stranded DNA-binding protein [Patescibacteria group bacterium]